jgi:hypothetical protein
LEEKSSEAERELVEGGVVSAAEWRNAAKQSRCSEMEEMEGIKLWGCGCC